MTSITRPVSRLVNCQSAPHGVSREIIVTVYPGGIIGLREYRRRKSSEVFVGASQLYSQKIIQKGMQ